MTDLTGKTIKGYELQQRIGAGGFGAVYRAYQPAVRREVAMKVILPEHASQPDFVRRFETEAQVVARLEHPHIVPLYDFWRDPDGAFLVMRYLRGGSLRLLVERAPLAPADVVRMVEQLCGALTVAHRGGVVHRDIKPDNILLDEDRNAYLADFGIAKLGDTPPTPDDDEGIVGSPAYLSPEQIMLEPVSARSDIYSLGIVIYEMLVGKAPFDAPTASTLIMKHLHEPLPSLRGLRDDLPDAIEAVLYRATSKVANQRYESALALALDLRRAVLGSAAAVPATGERLPEPTPDDLVRLGITDVFTASGLEPVNPYKGLRAFEEADADDFYGRETLVTRLLERFRENVPGARFLAVVGPSGSGKSSVVKAGVVPALRRGDLPLSQTWLVSEMTPGANPLNELREALLRVAVNPDPALAARLEAQTGLTDAVEVLLPEGGHLLLVIDQFEEVFTQLEDDTARAHLLALLLAAVDDPRARVHLILTLRADFYDRPLQYTAFGDLLRRRTEVVLPMSSEELERAISVPADRAGLGLEVGLVTQIVADVSEQPGALPLMQYALTELYERRDGRFLSVQAYQDIGGVSGALAKRAEDLFSALDDDGKAAARQMFLRLVTPGEGTEDTRRRVRQSELLALEDAPAVQGALNRFGKYRLLTFDHDPLTRTPTVEVAHEALIRRWARLRGWLNETRDSLRMQRRVAQAAEEWTNARRDASFLAAGTRLDQFDNLLSEADHGGIKLTESERDYIIASLKQRAEERAAEAARSAREQANEQRARTFLYALVAVMSLAAVVATLLAFVAANQTQQAQNNAATATVAQGQAITQAQTSRALAFAASAQLALGSQNTDLALLLGLAAAQTDPGSPLVQAALADAAYAPGTRRVFSGHTDRVNQVVYSADGARALSSSRDRTAILWDVATGQILQRLGGIGTDGHNDSVWSVALSPDGRTALTGSYDYSLILWDLDSGRPLRRFVGHTAAVFGVAFAPDGKSALSASLDNTLILWDVETGAALRTLVGHTDEVYDVAFSASGFTALSASRDGTVILWNVGAGTPLTTFSTPDLTPQWAVAYAPGETGALSGGDDGALYVWNFEVGGLERTFSDEGGHSARITDISFGPGGEYVVTCAEDNTAVLWDFSDGLSLHRYAGLSAPLYGVSFAPDGLGFLTAAWDNSVRLWDVRSGAEVLRYVRTAGGDTPSGDTAYDGNVHSAVYSPDGQTVLTAGDDGQVILWDRATGAPLRFFAHDDGTPAHSAPALVVAFSADGRTALSGGDDYRMVLWDVATGKALRVFGSATTGHTNGVYSLAFGPDGTRALSGSRDNTLILWDLATGDELRRFIGHTHYVNAVVFLPDGQRAISGSWDATMRMWDLNTGEALRVYEGHGDWVRALALLPDGRTILSGSADSTLILWDIESGERLRRFEGHSTQIVSIYVSADGRLAVSGSADQLIIVWDLAAGRELRRYAGHEGFVRSVRFSADAGRILSAGADGTVREWLLTLRTDDLIAWARANRALRDFTCAERERFSVTPLCPAPTPIPRPGTTGT